MRLLVVATLTLLFISCSKNDPDPTPPVVVMPTDVDTLGGWQFKKIDSLGRTLSDITFTDANTGFTCGENKALFKTSDGGTTWQPVSISLGSNYSNIQFLNTQYGFMTSFGGNGLNGVLRTINGGATWQFAATPTSAIDVFFLNPGFGFCTSFSGLLKSADSGKTWSTVPATANQYTNSLWFLNATKGFVTVQRSSSNNIFATLDGGSSFSLAASDSSELGYSPVYFSNTNNGCTGLGNSLYTTNDGGANWQKLKAFTKNVLDVKNSSPADYYVSTSNEVWHTTNTGNSWVREMKLAAGHEAVEFALNQPGRTWISGAGGRVYYK